MKADGSDRRNTKKQVLSKTETFASLPTPLVPTSSLLAAPPPHLLPGAHVRHSTQDEE